VYLALCRLVDVVASSSLFTSWVVFSVNFVKPNYLTEGELSNNHARVRNDDL